MTFTLFSEKLQKLIKEKGFIAPTLPQKMGIPEILKGTDVLILAPTGIGKTETALLPVLDMIYKANSEKTPEASRTKPIAALYITPLKSLNRDLQERMFWWADKLDLMIDVRHGDTTQKERAAQRENPPHLLVTTPETLQALLPSKIFRNHLRNVKHVVIDEIHELVGSKRGVQLSLALERLRYIAGDFQRIGLSATIGSPELVAEFIGGAKIISAAADKKYNIRVESPKPSLSDAALAEKLYTGPETTARLRRLHELISEHKSVLVFTNTRETAEVLSSRLRTFDKKLQQSVHHGSLAKEGRIKSEQQFKSQELKSLIATSSLELGIDIGSVDLVIQYLSPRQVARLIQRVGRAGHKSGLVSKGVLITGDEDAFESSVVAKMAAQKILEPIRIHEGALDVLANQIIGMAMDEYENTDIKMYDIIKKSFAFRNITKKDFDDMLKFLKELYMLWINPMPDGTNEVKRSRKCFEYYFSNLTMIPDKSAYRVISVIEHEPVGNLDEAFVAEHGQPGNKFIFAGRAWKIIQIDKDRVMVEPTDDIESAIPSWEGELIPVPYEISQNVGRLRRELLKKEISDEYNVDSNTAAVMKSIVDQHASKHPLPDDKTVLIEDWKDFVIIHLCGGSMANDTIGRYLSAKLSTDTGTAVNMKSDPYRIMLQTMAKKEKVKEILENVDDLEPTLLSELDRSTMFKYRFIHVAKRFGVISRQAKFDQINMNRMITAYANSPIYKETIRELMIDKMDLQRAQEIVSHIQEGKIKIKIQDGLSYLGELGLVHKFKEVMKPRMPAAEIFEAFKKRLLNTKVKLVCINCGEWTKILRVADAEDQPECPKCTSRLIAVLSRRQKDFSSIIKKQKTIKKVKLTTEQSKELTSIRRTADLTIVYGKKALIALAGKGVGPQTATRILAKRHKEQDQLLKDILFAEKEFVRTKVYWS